MYGERMEDVWRTEGDKHKEREREAPTRVTSLDQALTVRCSPNILPPLKKKNVSCTVAYSGVYV